MQDQSAGRFKWMRNRCWRQPLAIGAGPLVTLIAVAALAVVGCGGGGDDDENGGGNQANFRAATAADLENRTFTFADGVAFGLPGEVVTLTFGAFDGDVGAFTLESGGQAARGVATIASCSYDVTLSAIAGIAANSAIVHDPCEVDDGTGAYRGQNAAADVSESDAPASADPVRLATPSRSTTIAITADDRRVVVPNRVKDTVSVIEVRDAGGADAQDLLAEIDVGDEPRHVALSPDDQEAYVTNAISGSVSVIRLTGADALSVVNTIGVGTEPRGIAMTPNGAHLYVANHTGRSISVIDVAQQAVVDTIPVSGNPTAIAITNDGDADDADEQVFVTQFFAELIPDGPGEGFDDGKQGVVYSFPTADPSAMSRITLSPLANVGFTADRTAFCAQSNANVHSNIFCPDTEGAPDSASITSDPQGAFPNQLHDALIRGDRLYLPNIGAGPEPPVRFNVNVQALVHVVDAVAYAEVAEAHVNLNDQIKTETQPDPPEGSLDRLFGNDLVAMDADASGSDFLLVSRGGNYVMRAGLNDAGQLDIGAPDNVVRLQTGNIPTGVAMSSDGQRAYTNNEINTSVSALNLETNTVIDREYLVQRAACAG